MRYTRALAGLLLLCLLLTLWPAALSADDGIYIVQPGDTLRKIAAAHGTTMQAILEANGIKDPDMIYSGQRLRIPGKTSAQTPSAPTLTPSPPQPPTAMPTATVTPQSPTATPTATATLPASTATSSTPVILTPGAPGTGANAPAGETPDPVSLQMSTNIVKQPASYTVRSGDTLAKIAAAHGTTIQALMQANDITLPDLIRSGQTLVIPGSVPIVRPPSTATPTAAVAPTARPPVPAPTGGTGLVVTISQQRCYLFRGGSLTNVWPCSTGRKGWGTAVGNFKVLSKMPRAYGSTWGYWLPYWLGIYYAGKLENGIHALPVSAKSGYKDWGNKIGTPISFGCVVLQDAAAKTIYDMAYIGMPVVIRN